MVLGLTPLAPSRAEANISLARRFDARTGRPEAARDAESDKRSERDAPRKGEHERGLPAQKFGWNAVFILIAFEYLAAGLAWLLIDCTKPIEPPPIERS